MTRFIAGAVAGLIVGTAATAWFTHRPTAPTTATVTPLKGAALRIIEMTRTPTKTVIDTRYDGSGESRITVPTNPYRYAACAFVSTDRSAYVGAGYTWRRFTGLGGVWFRNNDGYAGGIWIGGIYSF